MKRLLVIPMLAITGAAVAATPPPPVRAMPPAADFDQRIDNPWFPLRRGTTFTYSGLQGKQHRKVTVFVTHKTKLILGIKATVVLDQDFVDGKPSEKTYDWYGQDKNGNVWYLGEDSRDFVKGKWQRSDGSWEAGVNGARAGIVMQAHPRVDGAYRQEFLVGHAEDVAKVIATSTAVKVPYGRFVHALETAEWSPLEPGVVEHKYYVRGVGNVRTTMVKGGREEEWLVSVKR
jgi:hypothetical protein